MITAVEINGALRTRFCAPEWATAFEVGERTGGSSRRADCVAMNCYNSRGLEIHGVEVKAHRADWRRELKNPDKAEQGVFRYCDRWWIAAPKGLVQPEELPENWGLLEFENGNLTQRVKAGKLSPIAPDKSFMASFLRGVSTPSADELRVLVHRETQVMRQRHEDAMQGIRQKHAEEVRKYSENDQLLRSLFGLNSWGWLGENEAREVAAFVQVARKLSPESRESYLRNARSGVEHALASLDAALATMRILGAESGGES